MTQKKGHTVVSAQIADNNLPYLARYRTKTLPSPGKLPSQDEAGTQITFE